MEKENASGQLNNNIEQQDVGLPIGDDADMLSWNNDVEFYMSDLIGAEDEDHQTDLTNDDEDHHSEAENGRPSRRTPRFTMRQIAELEAKFKACPHPGHQDRQELGARIGLEERQVKFWFQNRRTQKKLRDCGDENRDMMKENAKLHAENRELKRRVSLLPPCFVCRESTLPPQERSEKGHLLYENASLKDELLRRKAHMKKLIQEAEAQAQQRPLPASTSSSAGRHLQASASMDPVAVHQQQQAFNYNTNGSRTNQKETLLLVSLAERAMKELVVLATTSGEPFWLPTIDGGEMLNHEVYSHTFPGLLGLCPQGFVKEATRDMDIIRGTAMDLATMLTDVEHWSETFPGIVASVSSSNVISSGTLSMRDGLIQLMNVDLWVQSPRLLTRSVKFLRFSKMMPNRKWVVVDVSVDGIYGVEQTSCRLLPSGCLLEDMVGGDCCKVTWLVHAEYDETTVPFLFRPFLQSGQALGASRWLRSLQRQCEYMAVLHSSHVESGSTSGAAISTLGRRGVLELGHRMTASFYAAVSGPINVPSTNIIDQWRVRSGTGAERFEAAVRMVTWNCAEIMPGEPAVTVVSATTTVWMPDTPPQCVFEYLCNLQRRAEWDTDANGGAVQELSSIATSTYFYGNAVSVLRPSIVTAHGRNSNNMRILQEASTDASCCLVVYSFIEESLMCGVMDGGDNSSIFLLPSGAAILPDGHGAEHNAANTSFYSNNNSGGSLLTVAYQAMMHGSPTGNFASQEFDAAGQRLCHTIKMIKAAVRAKNIIPA